MKTLIEPESDQFGEFFQGCRIVMSAPNVAFLVGEHAVLRGTPSVVLTMPTRVYVGIKKRERTETWLTSKAIDSNGTLQSAQVREDPNLVGIKHLKSFAEAYYGAKTKILEHILGQIEHLAIRVLSDITPGSGANWSGAFSSALAGCVHFGLLENQRNPDVICVALNSWKVKDTWRTDKRFKDINLLAFFLESAFHNGSASGYGTVVSLLGPATPVVYKTCRRLRDGPPHINVYSSVDPLDSNNGTKEVISRLRDIADSVQLVSLSSNFRQLMYIAVIDTRKRKDIGTAGAISHVLVELLGDLKEAGEKVPNNLSLRDFHSPAPPDNIWFALDYYIIAFIYFLELSLREGARFLPKAIGYMNSVSNVLLSLGLGWKEFTDVSTRVLTADRIDQSNTAVKLSGGGTAGVCTLLSTELGYSTLAEILGESDCILYSSDRSPEPYGLHLHELREE